jgi:hypothetical protein
MSRTGYIIYIKQTKESHMTEHEIIELALSILHEKIQSDPDFRREIAEGQDIDEYELANAIANVFYRH